MRWLVGGREGRKTRRGVDRLFGFEFFLVAGSRGSMANGASGEVPTDLMNDRACQNCTAGMNMVLRTPYFAW